MPGKVYGRFEEHPGGMLQPNRTFSADESYRYGFNGKENDDEVKGESNQQDYGMRIYDPRIIRFLSVDPITREYPELTPYQFASNRPIEGIDRDGLEFEKPKWMEVVGAGEPKATNSNSPAVKQVTLNTTSSCHGATNPNNQFGNTSQGYDWDWYWNAIDKFNKKLKLDEFRAGHQLSGQVFTSSDARGLNGSIPKIPPSEPSENIDGITANVKGIMKLEKVPVGPEYPIKFKKITEKYKTSYETLKKSYDGWKSVASNWNPMIQYFTDLLKLYSASTTTPVQPTTASTTSDVSRGPFYGIPKGSPVYRRSINTTVIVEDDNHAHLAPDHIKPLDTIPKIK